MIYGLISLIGVVTRGKVLTFCVSCNVIYRRPLPQGRKLTIFVPYGRSRRHRLDGIVRPSLKSFYVNIKSAAGVSIVVRKPCLKDRATRVESYRKSDFFSTFFD